VGGSEGVCVYCEVFLLGLNEFVYSVSCGWVQMSVCVL